MSFFLSKGRRTSFPPKQPPRFVPPLVILRENFWDLLLLNFCFCSCVLPFAAAGLFFFFAGALLPAVLCFALTALLSGPSGCAMARVFCDWQCGRACAPVRRFWSAFRGNIKHGALLGLFYQSMLALAGFAACVYFFSPQGSPLFLLCGWLSLFLFLAIFLSSFYAYMMAANLALSLPQILKNAFLLFFLDWKDSLFLCAASVLCALAVLSALPFTLFLLPAGGFSILWLFNSCFAWRGILRFAVLPSAQEKE